MYQEPFATQKTTKGIGEISSDLLHPVTIWLGENSSYLNLASREVNHEKDQMAYQPSGSPNLNGKEIRRSKGIPMSFQEGFPRSFLAPFRAWNDAIFV